MQTLFNRLRRAIAAFGVVILASTRLLAAEPPLPGTAVTATKAKNVCFADTLAVTGVLMPGRSPVRPDQEGLLISRWSADVGDSACRRAAAQLRGRTRNQRQQIWCRSRRGRPRRAAVVGTMLRPAESALPIIAQGRPGGVGRGSQRTWRVAKWPKSKSWVGELSDRFNNKRRPDDQQGEARVFVGANPALRTGTFARSIVTLGQSCGIAIPLSGVLYGKEGPVVQVVRGERVQTRAITTGPTFDGKVQVTKGLAEGDVVVMRAGAFLRDGDPCGQCWRMIRAPANSR
jgi:hypothetical protein